VGRQVGPELGLKVGEDDGSHDGPADGLKVGAAVGMSVGRSVGISVTGQTYPLCQLLGARRMMIVEAACAALCATPFHAGEAGCTGDQCGAPIAALTSLPTSWPT